jgi:hypothetical protein
MMQILNDMKSISILSCVLATFALSGCGNGVQNSALPTLGNSTPKQQPVSLIRTPTETVESTAPAIRPIDTAKVTRAVERFRVNNGGKDATHQIAGADLDADGTPEALVYISGEDWCSITGCTLLVMRAGTTGYAVISRVKRVRLPVGISRQSSSGWRDLLLATGVAGSIRLVTLKFDGSAYPGNASTQAPVAAGDATNLEIALRPTKSIATTNAEAPGSNLIANQN